MRRNKEGKREKKKEEEEEGKWEDVENGERR